jgi:transcriptional regulator with XRE-family HTH domain
MTGLDHQAELLKAARNRKGWSQSRLAATIEEVARRLSKVGDLPPGGRQTLIQYISYFENGKRAVPERLRPILCEVFQASNEDLGLTAATAKPLGLVRLPALPAEHLRSSGPIVISSLRMVLEANLQADAQIGPSYLIPAIQAQLPVIEQICRMTRDGDHEEALRIGSQFTEFCGWLYQDSGDSECAMYWTERSLEYAIELDDRRVISYVLMRKSNIATDAGQPGQGLGLANAALKQRSYLTPRLHAVVLRQRANAFAMLHERSNFARDADEAFKQAIVGASQDEPDLAPYCTPSYVEMETGASWVKLDSAKAALPVFEESRTSWNAVEQVRDRALCLARLATAYAATGEVEQACGVAEELIAVAGGLSSARVSTQVADLRRSLVSGQQNLAVRDLLRRLEAFKDPLRTI